MTRTNLDRGGLAGNGLDENLHLILRLLAASEVQNRSQSLLLLDVVVGESAAILQIVRPSQRSQALLVRADALLVLGYKD